MMVRRNVKRTFGDERQFVENFGGGERFARTFPRRR